MAGDGGAGTGGVLRPEAPAGSAVRLGLHAHDRVGDHPRRANFRAPGVPLRADVLKFGGGEELLFREDGEAPAKDGRMRSGNWEQSRSSTAPTACPAR